MRQIVLIGLLLLASSAWAETLLVTGGDATYHEASGTGVLTPLASPAGGGATSPQLGTLTSGAAGIFALDFGDWPGRTWLATFDTAGAATAAVELTYQGAPVPLAEGLALDASGVLWVTFCTGSDLVTYQSGHLGRVDPATGAITSVVALSGVGNALPDGDAIEWAAGVLYLADAVPVWGTRLYTVDPSTGVISLIGHVQRGVVQYQVTDLAWDGTTLWAETIGNLAGGQLVKVNRATARATTSGAPHTAVDGVAVCRGKRCR